MTRSRPPQCGQTERSIASTLRKRSIHARSHCERDADCYAISRHRCRGSVVVGFAVSFAQRLSADLRVVAAPAAGRRTPGVAGTTLLRCLAFGAHSRDGPVVRTKLPRGRGTSAASRARKSSGSNTKCVVPSRYGVFNW